MITDASLMTKEWKIFYYKINLKLPVNNNGKTANSDTLCYNMVVLILTRISNPPIYICEVIIAKNCNFNNIITKPTHKFQHIYYSLHCIHR